VTARPWQVAGQREHIIAGDLMPSVAAENAVALWPMAVYFALVILLVVSIVGISYVLGQRHREPATGQPYESGILATGTARLRMSVKFYLIAVFFVIFDLEAVFIFAWAISFRELGWRGYVEMLVFIGILLAALAYLWRQGALNWSPTERRRRNFQ
jgi:NADH-quinone oxidoreductase subunit A